MDNYTKFGLGAVVAVALVGGGGGYLLGRSGKQPIKEEKKVPVVEIVEIRGAQGTYKAFRIEDTYIVVDNENTVRFVKPEGKNPFRLVTRKETVRELSANLEETVNTLETEFLTVNGLTGTPTFESTIPKVTVIKKEK